MSQHVRRDTGKGKGKEQLELRGTQSRQEVPPAMHNDALRYQSDFFDPSPHPSADLQHFTPEPPASGPEQFNSAWQPDYEYYDLRTPGPDV
jgi:hypothetical protein